MSLIHNEPMLEMYIHETSQLIEQLEGNVLEIEASGSCSTERIGEIFRILHTIKGSSAMMLLDHIALLAHGLEDLFFFLREDAPPHPEWLIISEYMLEGIDYIKIELHKLRNGQEADGDFSVLSKAVTDYLNRLKRENPATASIVKEHVKTSQKYYIGQNKKGMPNGEVYRAVLYFEEGCEMENIRAFSVIHRLQELDKVRDIAYIPEDIMDNHDSVDIIRQDGFKISLHTEMEEQELHDFFAETLFLKKLDLQKLGTSEKHKLLASANKQMPDLSLAMVPGIAAGMTEGEAGEKLTHSASSMISVQVEKLDKLMDLVGELVIAESMVTQHPEIKGLHLEQFQKVARRLNKITTELQDAVMSIRMVSLAGTFQKMNRIVRDMCKKLDKVVKLELIGEETEVDKNVIERIADPLMHLIRNSIDHGIEEAGEREAAGKDRAGTVTLEAHNAGSEVLIIVKDDGKGLSKAKLLKRAAENNLLHKPEAEMTEKEIYNLIFLPGFSTKENITQFSGRGVGMDVVASNLAEIGGVVSVDSQEGQGTAITLKIPLTLAIIDGMNVRVGDARYTIPIIAVRESFRPKERDWIQDPDGNEMIWVRGECIPILRLHRRFHVRTDVTGQQEGILIIVEHNGRSLCLFADELLGQQQVVIKPLPAYIRYMRSIEGVSGCTLLGDGKISLILDAAGLMLR